MCGEKIAPEIELSFVGVAFLINDDSIEMSKFADELIRVYIYVYVDWRMALWSIPSTLVLAAGALDSVTS